MGGGVAANGVSNRATGGNYGGGGSGASAHTFTGGSGAGGIAIVKW